MNKLLQTVALTIIGMDVLSGVVIMIFKYFISAFGTQVSRILIAY